MTNLEFVSSISGVLKSNTTDNRIPKRLILSLGRDASRFLISQKLLDRTIYQDTNIFSNITCFEFESIDSKKCPSIEFRTCKTLMKSKKPLPKLIFARTGASIKEVVSLDGDFTFSFVDEAQYRRNKKRQNQLKDQVFVYLGTDNHLYIPDREIYSIDIVLLTLNKEDAIEASCCEDTKDTCLNYWDLEFVCSDKLIEAVKDMTLQRLSMTRQIVEDKNGNNLENG